MPTPTPSAPEHALNAIRDWEKQFDCLRGFIFLFSEELQGGRIVPILCGRWTCPKCSDYKARHYAARILNAKPERCLTLTASRRTGRTPRQKLNCMKKAVQRLAKELRKLGYLFEYACVWEATKNGNPHAHLAIWGEYIPQKLISQLWNQYAFARIVDIRVIDDSFLHQHNFVKYMLKSATRTHELLEGRKHITFSTAYDRYPAPPPENPMPADTIALVFPVSSGNILAKLLAFGNVVLETSHDHTDYRFKPLSVDGTLSTQQILDRMEGLPRTNG